MTHSEQAMDDLLSAGAGTHKRPLPQPTLLSQPYWDACRRGDLLFLECQDCGHRFFPPESACVRCLSERTSWKKSEGRGSIYSFSVIHQEVAPGFPVPSVFAIVELDEGYAMFSNVVGCRPEEVRIGQRVAVEFTPWTSEITLPFFHLDASEDT